MLLGSCLAALLAGCGEDDKGKAGNPLAEDQTQQEGPPATTQTQPAEPPAEEEPAAEVEVAESGFSELEDTVAYGAVLKNSSQDSEVSEIEVTINALDARGDVLTTDTKNVSVIPPGEEFVIGGDLDPGGDTVEELDIEVEAGDSGPPEHPLPKVTNVRIQEEEYGGLNVRAQVENTLDKELSSITDVFGVVRNAKGKIIAGGFTFPENGINPGRKASVELNFLYDLPGAESAEVSVDNEITP
ncbi:MAG TPA: hypothetical protein VF715_14060 [Thermoleophilaceae bacterium]